MNFEFDNNLPIYIQLVEQLKIAIISNRILSGDKIPSVRDLAIQFKVNPNTMQKALAELEQLELIYTKRTNGKYVTSNQELINKYKENYAKELTNKYFSNMESIGYTKNEIIKYIEELGGIKR